MLQIKRKKTLIFSLIFVILVITFFITRTIVFNYVLKKISGKLQHDYKLELNIGNKEFKGLRSILFTNITVTDSSKNEVITSDSLFLQVRIWPIIFGDLRFRKIYSDRLIVNLNGAFLDSLKRTTHSDTLNKDTLNSINYGKSIDRIFNLLFSQVPTEAIIDSAQFNFVRDENIFGFQCKHFELQKGIFNGTFEMTDNTDTSYFLANGQIDRSSKVIDCNFKPFIENSISIPYITKKWETEIKFDSIHFSFNYQKYSWDVLSFSGIAEASNFTIKNKRIAPTAVNIVKGTLNFNINAGENFIELDSTSIIGVNKFAISPYVKYLNDGQKQLYIKIPQTTFEAKNMFESFPDGLFCSLKNMQVSGNLTYALDFYVNLNQPDSIKFLSELKKDNFKINRYGNANLSMLNDTFVHQIYERDQQVYSILVSPENPNWVPLSGISPFLQNSVLTSEDGGFFFHKGFNEEAFMNSISENIKQRRFARGGSTITMQLVKNVFLTRNKSVSRKLEEVLMVWLIENNHIVSKERMFEVYLNIIEWGPGIYGIKPAAYYYFKKQPSELTLNESIFLASIIPCPKYFKYQFKEPGVLREGMEWYYKRLPEMMLKRNQITPADTIGIRPFIELKGEAAKLLVAPDTIKIDSTFIEEPLFP